MRAHKIANVKFDETVCTTHGTSRHGLSKAAVRLKRRRNRVAKRRDNQIAFLEQS